MTIFFSHNIVKTKTKHSKCKSKLNSLLQSRRPEHRQSSNDEHKCNHGPCAPTQKGTAAAVSIACLLILILADHSSHPVTSRSRNPATLLTCRAFVTQDDLPAFYISAYSLLFTTSTTDTTYTAKEIVTTDQRLVASLYILFSARTRP